MFGRSQSGPGGLSINTNSANSLSVPSDPKTQTSSLFQTQQQDKPAGGLFGSSSATSQPQDSTSLFSTTTSQPPQTSSFRNTTSNQGGLFGQQSTSNQQQQAGTLFGGQVSHSQAQDGGLLGSQTNQPPSQQQSGGLFESLANKPKESNLFGSAQIQQPEQSSGMFSMDQNQSQASNSLGASTGQTKYQALFGPSSAQKQQNPFASANAARTQQQPAPSIFPGSIGQYSQQQQTIPGVRISLNELRPTTRFNDLHEELQKVIETVDNFVQGQIHCQEQCEAANEPIDRICMSIPSDVDYCARTLSTMQQSLENDANAISYAKGLTKTDAADAKLSMKALNSMRVPPQFHQSGLWHPTLISQALGPSLSDEDADANASTDIVSYFEKQAIAMTKTLDDYKNRIIEVETHLKGIEASTVQQMQQMMFIKNRDGGERSAEDQVRELAAVLREFENGILGVAGKVGGVREKVLEVILGNYGNLNVRSRRSGML